MSDTTYIALLRGINVGGHKVKMADLRALFGKLGLANVRSYIQTGNVFFESDENDVQALRAMIEAHLLKTLGYEVPTCIRTVGELEQVMAHDPFRAVKVTPDVRLSITFLAQPSAVDLPMPYLTPDGAYEVIERTPHELFTVWRLQQGRPGRTYGLVEKELGVPTTTRFWHTTAKILAAAKASPRT